LFASGPHAERWTRALAPRFGPFEPDPLAAAIGAPPGIERQRKHGLARVEARLVEARRQAATLREREALASLAAAERAVAELADVPGASAWAAEVQLQLGAVAAQAGLLELAQAAFRRAATLEPGRRLLPAEAAPEVVALCAAIHTELAAAPSGVFQVQATAAAARVFLDDVELGTAPLRARAVVGRHLLRVEAPGHGSYGSFIDVLSGERPELLVQLTPLPRVARARALLGAVRTGDHPRIAAELRASHALGVTPALTAVLIVETDRDGRRALLVRCDRSACRGPTRARWLAAIDLASTVVNDVELAEARAWLARPESATDDATPLWKRWYVWGGAALALTAGAVVLGFAVQPEPEQRLRVEVDPGGL
jgi:hypothetical protein